MASTATSTPLSLSSSSALVNAKAPARPESAAASPSAVLPALHSQTHHARPSAASYVKIARNVVAKVSGDPPVEVITAGTPEIVKTIQETWNKIEDKYAVTSLAVAGGVALWASAGMISAIDKLPVVPGVLELIGIGYTGWFAYQNLIFKPDREALLQKIKDTYKEIIGSS